MFRKLLAIAAVCLATADVTARAQILDLTPTEATSYGPLTSASGGTFIVTNTEFQPTGTGNIQPFLTIQRNGSEQGFNTNTKNILDNKRMGGPDNNTNTGFTKAILLDDLEAVTIAGQTGTYFQFLIDATETGNAEVDRISLNQFQLFVSDVALGTGYRLTGATSTTNAEISFSNVIDANAVEVFQLSDVSKVAPNTSFEIRFDSSRGSGSGDMYFYVSTALFTNYLEQGKYLTLYAQLGSPPGLYGTDAGFEEFAYRGGVTLTEVPEPASIVMSLTGAIPLGLWALRRRKQATA